MRADHICRHLSALSGPLVLLLQLIDCSQYDASSPITVQHNKAVDGGDQLETASGTPSSVAQFGLEPVGLKLKMARSSAPEGNHQSSRLVFLMKRSAPVAPTTEGHENDISVGGPIDGNKAGGHSQNRDPEPASLQAVNTAKKSEDDSHLDGEFAESLDNNFATARGGNLLGKLKSFIESLSDKIILSVNNLKAEQGNGLDTNNDHTTLIERRKKRLSKEIVQIIQDDINLAGASNRSEKANQTAKQSTNTNINSIDSTPTLKSILSGKNIKTTEQTNNTPIKSTSAVWMQNLESLLKDQDLRIENSTFDLGHIKRLHQRELADTNSLTPIAQLKEKVMSFMHFG